MHFNVASWFPDNVRIKPHFNTQCPLSPTVPAALHYSRSAPLFCAFFRVPVEQLLKDLQLFFLPDTTTTPLQYTAILDHQWYFVTKIVLTYCEKKIVLVIEKNFWNSRLKAKNLQNFWDHQNNLFKQWKVRTIFETECCFDLFLEVSQI